MSLFQTDSSDNLLPQDGVLHDFGCVLGLQDACGYFTDLLQHTPWQHDEVVLFGKRIQTARKVAWFGNAAYYYSGVLKRPVTWTEPVLALKALVEQQTGHVFNSCLINLYEHGNQGVTWHSDDETTLGPEPIIASLSLGADRRFCLKHKTLGTKWELTLTAGQLIVMQGPMQRCWLHCIPKMAAVTNARINLTFRQINHTQIQV